MKGSIKNDKGGLLGKLLIYVGSVCILVCIALLIYLRVKSKDTIKVEDDTTELATATDSYETNSTSNDSYDISMEVPANDLVYSSIFQEITGELPVSVFDKQTGAAFTLLTIPNGFNESRFTFESEFSQGNLTVDSFIFGDSVGNAVPNEVPNVSYIVYENCVFNGISANVVIYNIVEKDVTLVCITRDITETLVFCRYQELKEVSHAE